MSSASRKAKQIAARIGRQLQNAVGKGDAAARDFLMARLWETLSTPAPVQWLVSKKTGRRYPKVLKKATLGAPPRLITGRLRAGMLGRVIHGGLMYLKSTARSVGGYDYGSHHEGQLPNRPPSGGKHKFAQPTVDRYRTELKQIAKRTILVEWRR